MSKRFPIKETLEYIKSLGFNTVNYKQINNLSLDLLSSLLQEWRKSSDIEIDGIVLTPSANNKPSMPEVDYKWNDTNIDI